MKNKLKSSIYSLSMAILTTGLACTVHAGLLEKADWKVTGSDGQPITAATDNNLKSIWKGPGAQVTGQSITIDLGSPHVIQRIVLDPGKSITGFPRSLDILAGDSPDALKPCASMPHNEDVVKVITFNPAVGRYVRLSVGKEQSGYAWAVAELDIYGHRNTAAMAEGNAVTVAADAPDIMKIGAEDLGFYLGQITEGAYPVTSPEKATEYKGRIFRLETPAPVKTGMTFQESFNLEQFTISEQGKDIVFQGQTLRAVFYAAKEFLERQGVHWTYPAANCDLIPGKKKLDTSFLPLTWKPPVVRRMMAGSNGNIRNETNLWIIRSGLNADWGKLPQLLGGNPCAVGNICWGATHTTCYIFKDGDPKVKHPEWYEGTTSKKGWAVMPDVTAPGLIDFVINRMKEEEKSRNENKFNPGSWSGFGLHPTDVPSWAVSERAEKMLGPFAKNDPKCGDDLAMSYDYSNLYGYWIDQTAKRMLKEFPGKILAGTAYENHYLPPSKIEKFPPNVYMVICAMAQPYNLPLTSPKTETMRNVFLGWSKKCSMLGLWDYSLLTMDGGGSYWPSQVPLVSAFADRYAFLAKLGFISILCQEDMATNGIYNPWNSYGFTRAAYKPGTPASEIIDEFFSGYFKEAAEPMRKYYTTFENHLIKNDIGLEGGAINFSYQPVKEAFPPEIVSEMETCLAKAKASAVHGFVKERIAKIEEGFKWSLGKAGVR